jgi:hypothetical protein
MMKLQVDVNVNSPEHAFEVLEEVGNLISEGDTRGVASDSEGTPVGRFELLQPQENASAC